MRASIKGCKPSLGLEAAVSQSWVEGMWGTKSRLCVSLGLGLFLQPRLALLLCSAKC